MPSAALRIAIVGLSYAPEPTGNAPYTTSLAEGLLAAGHDVRIVTAHPHYPEWTIREGYGQWSSSESVRGVPVRRLRHWVPRKPTAVRRALSELSFGVRAATASWGQPDVVLLVSPALLSSGLAMVHAKLSRVPVGVWVQDLYGLGVVETGTGGARTARLLRGIEARLFSSASGVVVIHERFRKYVVDELGVAGARVEVIRNWTHIGAVSEIDRPAVRRRFGWCDGETVVLHAGNQGLKQGLENVVEAARLADAARARVRFVLLGAGNQRSRLESTAAGIERLQFIDPLPDDEFLQALSGADILLVSEREGMTEMSVPSKLTSYFSTGRPVIAATGAGSVTDGEISASGGGIRVDAGDPAALLVAVCALGLDAARAAELGLAGLAYRERLLSDTVAIESFGRWLTSLAGSRDSSAGSVNSRSAERRQNPSFD
ncbi:MAG: glycosyltransferase family 4 protein [Cellulomonas sp.]|nr:glycosyltransferase family 4 protein [Cellulomonas sp.]